MPPRTVHVALAAWFVAMLAVGTTLLMRHEVGLPRPGVDPRLRSAMAMLRAPGDAGAWMSVHVLDAGCRCSQRIAEHLLVTERPVGVAEHVLLVGGDRALEGRLSRRGFHVVAVDRDELAARFHVLAAPLLVVAAPDGSIRYDGGYTTRKQGPAPRDLDIIADARAGVGVVALPINGCAVSESLRASLNPLGLP